MFLLGKIFVILCKKNTLWLPAVGVHLTPAMETLLPEPVLAAELGLVPAVAALPAVVVPQAARAVAAEYAITNSLPACG